MAKKLDKEALRRQLLGRFRRSDWGDRTNPPWHISGCPCNQYLAGYCTEECEEAQELVEQLGGFPKDFDPPRDERNHYRSSLETYG